MAQNFVEVGKTQEEKETLLEVVGLNDAQARHCLNAKTSYSEESSKQVIVQTEPTAGAVVGRPTATEPWGPGFPINTAKEPLKI